MPLGQIANIAEIFGALLVVIGIFFALVEIRHLRRQRRETPTMEIIRAFQSPEFTSPFHSRWFQWLSERMSEYPEYRNEEGAYSKYLHWKPEKGAVSRQKNGV